MPKTPDDLVKEYKDLYASLDAPRDIERAACTLYVSIFEKLKRKMRLDHAKAAKFIKDDFEIQDNKRLQFVEDGQHEDAYLCAQIQQAYRIFWNQVLNLSLGDNLIAKKDKPMSYPIDLSPRPKLYMGARTVRH